MKHLFATAVAMMTHQVDFCGGLIRAFGGTGLLQLSDCVSAVGQSCFQPRRYMHSSGRLPVEAERQATGPGCASLSGRSRVIELKNIIWNNRFVECARCRSQFIA